MPIEFSSKTIFYSWQSDLPAATNRTFIQTCIEKSIQAIKKDALHLDVVIDRDTSGIAGTPDISQTIFQNIDHCRVFIADVSFITQSGTKKVPNPNVLIELGYAVKVLGWDNIICVFNLDYGDVTELPFDLRHRRPLMYKITDPEDKTAVRRELAGQLEEQIKSVIDKQTSVDIIEDYIKLQVDTLLMSICNHIHKLLYGYADPMTLGKLNDLLNTTQYTVQQIFGQRKFLAFSVVIDWTAYKLTIEGIINNPTFIRFITDTRLSALIQLSNSITAIALIIDNRPLFVGHETNEDFQLIDARLMNPTNPPDSYRLVMKIPGDDQLKKVVDFGIIRKYKVDRALEMYSINPEELFYFCHSLSDIIKRMDDLIAAWENEILIDPATFKLY